MTLRIRLLPAGKMPIRATPGAAGLDCFAAEGGMLMAAGASLIGPPRIYRIRVSLGFCIEIPPGFEGQIRPRSGLGFKHGVHVAGGTVDSDYRGPVSALLFNLGSEPFTWAAGDRICQIVIAPVVCAELVAVEELGESERGGNGWGSSGR